MSLAGLRDSNPVGRGSYTPGRRLGGGHGGRPLVSRMVKLPWIPSEAEWLRVLDGFRAEPARNRLMVALDDPGTTAETWRSVVREVLASNAEQERPRRLAVANTGPAIPPEAVGRLFQPFWRLNGRRVHHDSGYGLGLSIEVTFPAMPDEPQPTAPAASTSQADAGAAHGSVRHDKNR